jgi:hypothetical protein
MKRDSRLQQFGALFTAMIAVIVSGGCELLCDDSDEISPEIFAQIPHREFQRGGRYFGAFSRVAAQTNVTPGYVCHVACGRMRSARVMTAISREIRRCDAAAATPCEGFTAAERAAFQHGGRYRGVLTIVASNLNVRRDTVSRTVRGDHLSARITGAVRAEMARVDAEIAAANGGGK